MWNLNCKSGQNVSQWITRIIYSILCAQLAAALYSSVDPPSNIQVNDLGYLGLLDISWQSPSSLIDSQCMVRYELQFYDTNEQRWKSIRTRYQTYRAAFNLGKDVLIKMRTYLNGPCTDEKDVWSEWVQINHTFPLQGDPKSKINNFYCINYNFVNLTCMWKPGHLSNNSNYELQYWQEGMSEKKPCDHYLKTNGINTGCMFGKEEFQLFSNLFICVTGMPGMIPVRSSYFTFQLQNVGKPGAPEDVNINTTESDKLMVDWRPPTGKIPSHCLKYDVQYRDDTDDWTSIADQRDTTFIIDIPEQSQVLCVRIRAKTNRYCANDGYWSDWSPEECWKEQTTILNMKWVYCVGAVIVLLSCILVITVLYVVRRKRHWSEKLQNKAKELVY